MPPFIRLLFVLIVSTMFGCGDTDSEPTAGQPPASVSLSIIWQTPEPEDPVLERSAPPRAQLEGCPEKVQKVQCRVYSETGAALTSGTWDCLLPEGTIDDIPPGTDRHFVLFGLDAEDRIVYRGQADHPCGPGEEVDVEIHASPFVPQLSKPTNGEQFRVLNPRLEWNDVEGQSEYHIIVSENSDLSNPLIELDIQAANYKLSGLAKSKTYHVQVYAADAYDNAGMGSEVRSFTVDALTLPDTGQTTSYTDTPKEDADFSTNPPTYTKLDENSRELAADATRWAMVRDEATGLIWEVKTAEDNIHNLNTRYTWQQGMEDFINTLNSERFGGFNQWRLPTVREFSTLPNFEYYEPTIDRYYFPNTAPESFWSSTETIYQSSPSHARVMWMREGKVEYLPKTDSARVRAVYSGEAFGNLNLLLANNNDGTVSDTVTGLMWQKDVEDQPRTWEEALDYCANLELAGHDDWRMPNIRELQSIIDYNRMNYCLDVNYFANPPGGFFWSSTSFANPWKTSPSDAEAYIVNFWIGNSKPQPKEKPDPAPPDGEVHNIFVRAVRDPR